MSLNSTSQEFVVSTNNRVEGMPPMPKIEVWTKDCSVNGSRAAFLAAMQKFADSPQFEKLVYRLENNFEIKVHHSVTLSMY
jgi:hypothetical protein